ncbi:MAG: 4-hydroxythreonine-4-phosphate dehydrogenase [Planctomycetota bacterium]|nr:MAG: 4-hydroxythreonine-4-phosphate dehydrogenase [Planctomycetota bacterium]
MRRLLMTKKVVLAATVGDTDGIGPEVLVKALSKLIPTLHDVKILVVGDPVEFRRVQKRLGVRLHERRIKMGDLPGALLRWKTPIFVLRDAAGIDAFGGVRLAADIVRRRIASALVTMPARKRLVASRTVGHTEFLAQLTGAKRVGMLLVCGRLRIMPLTLHIPLREVADSITGEKVEVAVRLLNEELRRLFGIESPRIGVAALNPHSGEAGLIGWEERDILAPAVQRLQNEGLWVSGPESVYVLIQQMMRGELDAAVALYHDQALTPLKLLYGNRGVNITLGLPFLRTSPLHGTADGIAGRGIADPRGAMDAITTALALLRRKV